MIRKIVWGSALIALTLLGACASEPLKSDINGSGASNGTKAAAIDIQNERYSIDINKVVISIAPVEAEAGSNAVFGLTIPSRVKLYGFFPMDKVVADAEWSISPVDKGVNLDPKTGKFHVVKNAPHNSTYQVTAKVKGREKPVVGKLLVYSKNANPLAGAWSDKAGKIKELVFSPDAKFSVTKHPFESYKDYWGTYTVDPETRQLKMKITGGNRVPTDANVSNAAYAFNAAGQLVLKNIYLGTLDPEDKGKTSYVFVPGSI